MKLRDFTVVTNALVDPFVVEFTKSIHKKIKNEDVRKKILNEGLYHITSELSADKIMESGYLNPTKGIINNHGVGNRVYMFAGIPDFNSYRRNLSDKTNPILSGNTEFTAIKLDINENELDSYKERFQDGAITYKGRCDLPEERAKKVSIVLDLNKDNEYFLREKTENEIRDGYTPSEELIEKLNFDKSRTNSVKEYFKSYKYDRDVAYNSIKATFEKIFARFRKNNTKALQEPKEIEGKSVKDSLNKNILDKDENNEFIETLRGQTNEYIDPKSKDKTYNEKSKEYIKI